jgi:hypothetical protein
VRHPLHREDQPPMGVTLWDIRRPCSQPPAAGSRRSPRASRHPRLPAVPPPPASPPVPGRGAHGAAISPAEDVEPPLLFGKENLQRSARSPGRLSHEVGRPDEDPSMPAAAVQGVTSTRSYRTSPSGLSQMSGRTA